MSSIYELTGDWLRAYDLIDAEEFDEDVLIETLEQIEEDIEDKADSYAKLMKNLAAEAEGLKKGDYIAISEGEIVAVEKSKNAAIISMLEGVDMDDYELITLFVGRDVSDDTRVEITDRIEELYPDLEITVYEGGQDVYDYYVGVE